MNHYLPYSILAGVCGSLGGLTSKLAFGRDGEKLGDVFFWVSVTFFIVFNLIMWWAYTRSLAKSSSALMPMVINTGVNFSLTGIFGAVLFEEIHGFVWWIGLFTVLCGITLMANEKKEHNE
ncbi:unnamed protein product [Auanema sp. JU1783]|nr:unnamed protein product [Auanema sp. JU1783]